MRNLFVLAACCFAFVSAYAQDANEPVTSTEEVSVDAGQVDDTAAPSKCGCGGKPK